MDEHARRGASVAPLAPLAALLLASVPLASMPLAGCTDQTKIHETELSELLVMLPGRYDNTAQVEADASTHASHPHDAVALTITHVFTPRLGHHVYYAQESAADDPRRVFSEKMYSFEVDEKRGIVETLFEFVEPVRWRDGQQNKDIFTVVTTDDVQPEACQLLWKKKESGFVATHDPKACPDAGGGTVVPQAELEGGVLTVGEYKFRRTRGH